MKTLAAVVPEQAGEWCGSDHPAHDPRDAQRGAAYLCNVWGYCIYRSYSVGAMATTSRTVSMPSSARKNGQHEASLPIAEPSHCFERDGALERRVSGGPGGTAQCLAVRWRNCSRRRNGQQRTPHPPCDVGLAPDTATRDHERR
jgi:hypothetical protein